MSDLGLLFWIIRIHTPIVSQLGGILSVRVWQNVFLTIIASEYLSLVLKLCYWLVTEPSEGLID